MKNNDWQMKCLKDFPVSLFLIFIIMIFIIIVVILYFFFDTYVLSFNENIKDLSPQQLHYFITEGYKKILVSFSLWSFVLIIASMGVAVQIMKMKKLLRSNS